MANIEIRIFSNIDISDMTIGILIRDKFGQDIFGTNTFYHNIKVDFQKDKEFLCTLNNVEINKIKDEYIFVNFNSLKEECFKK